MSNEQRRTLEFLREIRQVEIKYQMCLVCEDPYCGLDVKGTVGSLVKQMTGVYGYIPVQSIIESREESLKVPT